MEVHENIRSCAMEDKVLGEDYDSKSTNYHLLSNKITRQKMVQGH